MDPSWVMQQTSPRFPLRGRNPTRWRVVALCSTFGEKNGFGCLVVGRFGAGCFPLGSKLKGCRKIEVHMQNICKLKIIIHNWMYSIHMDIWHIVFRSVGWVTACWKDVKRWWPKHVRPQCESKGWTRFFFEAWNFSGALSGWHASHFHEHMQLTFSRKVQPPSWQLPWHQVCGAWIAGNTWVCRISVNFCSLQILKVNCFFLVELWSLSFFW